MRLRLIVCLTALLVVFAAPAWALHEGEFALAPQAGMVTTSGVPGGLFAADFGYGAGFGYGITDIFGVELDLLYSEHEELDEDETGELKLTHFFGGIGPRVNWNTQYVVPYLALLGAVSFLRYQADWEIGKNSFDDQQDAHAFGGALAGGLDVYVADGFTVGLAGRAGFLGSNLTYKHRDTDDGDAGAFGYFAGLLRLTLLF